MHADEVIIGVHLNQENQRREKMKQRKLNISVLGYALFFLLFSRIAVAAELFPAQINPALPTTADPVEMIVSGQFFTGGYTITSVQHNQVGNNISAAIYVDPPPPGSVVTQVIVPFSRTVNIGTLAEGDYTYNAQLIFNYDPITGMPGPIVRCCIWILFGNSRTSNAK